MGKPGSALQPGKRITLGDGVVVETVEVLPDGHRLVRFLGAAAAEAIAQFGRLPLPPYITRDPTEHRRGAVPDGLCPARGQRRGADRGPALHRRSCWTAAPRKGCVIAGLDLEVGPGTFKPVEVGRPRAST